MLRTLALTSVLVGQSLQAAVRSRDQVNNKNLDPLKFNKDGAFQISVFSDLHFAEDASSIGPEKDAMTAKVMGDVIDAELPDLVVLNGDLINGESTFKHNSTVYIDQIVAPMVDRNMTWASTYGNHDHNKNLNGTAMLEREHTWPGSRTDSMVPGKDAGTTNYYLPVYASNCSSKCTPKLILWFFDSRGGFYYQGGDQPNWVDKSVVEWFNKTNSDLVKEHGKEIPSLAFVHIPVYASLQLQKDSGIDKNQQPGINGETVIQQGAGWCEDKKGGCEYVNQDLPLMRALVATPGVIGLFSGHDHANSWCYKWDSKVGDMDLTGNGINLCYGQHTGYGGYGDWIRGGRQIIVTQEGLKNFEIDSHIRLESDEIVGSVSLNSTYNKDAYKATPEQKTFLKDAGASPKSPTLPISSAPHLAALGGFNSPLALFVGVIAWIML
ncbi:hypothetical protein F53441_824 [Fusarium austroafricanum]|uniref:Calcineurin-like phosphoesterase domain-containing protein n=1 Tax=Fusarium austroafricanum TaxID=2364996 RepID=A0A8H4P304_9HYPO|nr:hypothetical protein F53441_824 [Fusarium austroafricanum]